MTFWEEINERASAIFSNPAPAISPPVSRSIDLGRHNTIVYEFSLLREYAWHTDAVATVILSQKKTHRLSATDWVTCKCTRMHVLLSYPSAERIIAFIIGSYCLCFVADVTINTNIYRSTQFMMHDCRSGEIVERVQLSVSWFIGCHLSRAVKQYTLAASQNSYCPFWTAIPLYQD